MFRLAHILLACVFLLACGGDDSSAKDETIQPLSPKEKHSGKTFAEWAAEWVVYVNAFHPPTCANPIEDDTGESCAVDQDPSSPVFFLVGTFGGVVHRTCTVPKGKALFFPIVEIWGDNAGVPEDMTLTSDELSNYVEMAVARLSPKRLYLKVDGEKMGSLGDGVISSTPYTIDLAPRNNAYTCSSVPGVEGKFDGFVGGYWIMLPPLEPGMHEVAFGVTDGPDPSSGDPASSFKLDVKYDLIIE